MSSEAPHDEADFGLSPVPAAAEATDASKQTDSASASTAAVAVVAGDEAPAKPLFEIQQWNAVCLWGWKLSAEVCAICTSQEMSSNNLEELLIVQLICWSTASTQVQT